LSIERKKLTFRREGIPKDSLNVSQEFRRAVSEAIKEAGLSREEVVSLVFLLTGLKISKHVFDQATSSKKEYRIPAEVLHAICFITGSLEPMRVLARSIGCEVVEPEEEKELRLVRLIREKKRIEREIKRLQEELEMSYEE